MLEHLIKNHHCKLTETNKFGNTALLLAAWNGHIEMLEHLIKNHHCKLTETNKDGNTALLLAASNGHIEMLEHLIKNHHCKLTETNKFGNTPLLSAAYNGQIEMLKHLLLKPEVSIQERNRSEGDNVLSLAAWNGQVDTVRFLLEHGAYIDLLLNDGRSPKVVIEGHSNKAALPLLQASEQLIEMAAKGVKESFEQVQQTIAILGTGLNARRTEDGNTALHLAILRQDIPFIKLLLEKGARFDIPNKDLMNACQMADCSNNAIIKLMLNVAKVEQLTARLEKEGDNKNQNQTNKGLESAPDGKLKNETLQKGITNEDSGNIKNANAHLETKQQTESKGDRETKGERELIEKRSLHSPQGLQSQFSLKTSRFFDSALYQELHQLIEKTWVLLESFEALEAENGHINVINTNEIKNELKDALAFKFGMLLANGQSRCFDPVTAYKCLSGIGDGGDNGGNCNSSKNSNNINKDISLFQKANETCYQLLMGGHLLLEEGDALDKISISARGTQSPLIDNSDINVSGIPVESLESIESLDSNDTNDLMPASVSNTTVPASVSNATLPANVSNATAPASVSAPIPAPESEASRLLRLKTAIKHLLLSNSQDKSILGKLVAEYALGSEFSMFGISGLTGNDVNTQLVLIENLRTMNLSMIRLKEESQRQKEEAQRQAQSLAEENQRQREEAQRQVQALKDENQRQREETAQKYKDEHQRQKELKTKRGKPKIKR